MPTGNFRRIDLDLIFPAFLEKVLDAISACNDRGCVYIATRGYDTYGAQMALWAQGRTKPGPIVTRARGGESAHNFGLAIDFVRDIDIKPGVQPSWAKKDYAVLIEEIEKRGLHSGHKYADVPHVSWPRYTTASDMQPLRDAWDKSGSGARGTLESLREVWKEVK